MSALLRSSGFAAAVLTASGASLLAVLLARRTVLSIALGACVVAATLAGLAAEDVFEAALPIGLGLVALGALVSVRAPLVVRSAALLPGGLVLVVAVDAAVEGPPPWAQVLAFLAIVGVGPVAAAFDRDFPNLTFGLLLISALGVYATVPDTEQARALVGALLPVALIAFAVRRVPEPSGVMLGVALVAWVALVGGVARAGSVVGALGCLGVLALGPLSRRRSPVLVVALHIAVVVVASRVAGLRASAMTAAVIVVPVLAVAAAVLLGSGERSRNLP